MSRDTIALPIKRQELQAKKDSFLSKKLIRSKNYTQFCKLFGWDKKINELMAYHLCPTSEKVVLTVIFNKLQQQTQNHPPTTVNDIPAIRVSGDEISVLAGYSRRTVCNALAALEMKQLITVKRTNIRGSCKKQINQYLLTGAALEQVLKIKQRQWMLSKETDSSDVEIRSKPGERKLQLTKEEQGLALNCLLLPSPTPQFAQQQIDIEENAGIACSDSKKSGSAYVQSTAQLNNNLVNRKLSVDKIDASHLLKFINYYNNYQTELPSNRYIQRCWLDILTALDIDQTESKQEYALKHYPAEALLCAALITFWKANTQTRKPIRYPEKYYRTLLYSNRNDIQQLVNTASKLIRQIGVVAFAEKLKKMIKLSAASSNSLSQKLIIADEEDDSEIDIEEGNEPLEVNDDAYCTAELERPHSDNGLQRECRYVLGRLRSQYGGSNFDLVKTIYVTENYNLIVVLETSISLKNAGQIRYLAKHLSNHCNFQKLGRSEEFTKLKRTLFKIYYSEKCKHLPLQSGCINLLSCNNNQLRAARELLYKNRAGWQQRYGIAPIINSKLLHSSQFSCMWETALLHCKLIIIENIDKKLIKILEQNKEDLAKYLARGGVLVGAIESNQSPQLTELGLTLANVEIK